MARPFVCSNCGITTRKRAHFMWLAAIVGFFNGQAWVSDGPLCTRCAPSWTTTFGRVLYVLLAICILLLVWQVFAPKGEKGVTPNSRFLSDAQTSPDLVDTLG